MVTDIAGDSDSFERILAQVDIRLAPDVNLALLDRFERRQTQTTATNLQYWHRLRRLRRCQALLSKLGQHWHQTLAHVLSKLPILLVLLLFTKAKTRKGTQLRRQR